MRLELRNWSGKDRPSSLLGLSASSDWILSPPSDRDPSLLRNPFMYTLSRDCGQYAPQSRFVEVFLNSRNRQLDQRADYFGVYSLTEKIQAGKERLQLDPDPSSTANPLGLSQGIIFKFDRPGPGEKGLKILNQDSEVFLTSPKESELSFQDSQILQQILGDFSLALKSPDRLHPRSQKSALDYIDSPSWHTWRWLGELSKNVDLYRASSYFHIPLSGPSAGLIKAGPVWDFDRSLNSKDRRDDDPHGWTAGKTWLPDRPIGVSSWWAPLLNDPTFKIEHCKHWQTLRKGPLSRDNFEKRLIGLQRELSQKIENPAEGTLPISAFQRNTRRWPGTGPVGISLASEVTLISEWLQKRLAWIDHQVALVLGAK